MLQQTKFSIKRMYNALRGDFVKVGLRKLVSYIHCRLSTCDRLSKVGIQYDQTYILCKKENENHFHLFFTCEYSEVV